MYIIAIYASNTKAQERLGYYVADDEPASKARSRAEVHATERSAADRVAHIEATWNRVHCRVLPK